MSMNLDQLEKLVDDPLGHGVTLQGAIARVEHELGMTYVEYQSLLTLAFKKDELTVRDRLHAIISARRTERLSA